MSDISKQSNTVLLRKTTYRLHADAIEAAICAFLHINPDEIKSVSFEWQRYSNSEKAQIIVDVEEERGYEWID